MHSYKPLLIALMGAMTLSACSTTPIVVSDCAPPLTEYSMDFRKRVAAELATLPPQSATVEMIADYRVLREQVRACQP